MASGQFALISWYDSLRDTALLEELFDNRDGCHATPSEISLAMLFRPAAFHQRSHPVPKSETPKKVEYYWPLTAAEMRKMFSDGSMHSAPWLASAEKGRHVMEFVVTDIVARVKKLQSIPVI